MKAAFFTIVCLGLWLRIFIFEVVAISNFDLFPQFQAGEVLLVSRLSSFESGSWVLLKNFPNEGNYSVRRLGESVESGKWSTHVKVRGTLSENQVVSRNDIVGRVVMTLWAIPCRSSSELCSQTSYKILTFVN